MADELGGPAVPPVGGDDEPGAAPPDRRAARLGEALRRLGRGLRDLMAPGRVGLEATLRTVAQDLGDAFGHLRRQRRFVPLTLATLLALYVLSGLYLVSPGEAAVVTRFGKVVQPRVGPGLRWRLPWPIEVARTVNVAQVRREGVGVTFPNHPAELHPPEDIQLLTGDENLLAAKAIIQYRVREPADYLFRIDYNEDPLLRAVVKAVVTELAGELGVDTLLTSGRTGFQQQARDRAQQRLDAYRSGLEVVSIDLQEIVPPGDVAQAFRDVASAAEEKTKQINDAQGYANSILPQARGEAQRRLREAEGYRTDVVNRARGEAGRFADILAQYQQDAQVFGPQVTRYRLYVETMERVLLRAKKYVVQPGPNGEPVNVRLLEQLPTLPSAPSGRP